MQKVLVIIGPTGVGKTALSIQIAQHYQCPIISADSRQIYKEIPIGTAAPTKQEQQSVKHYFIGNKSITEQYNAGQYERDCLQLLEQLNREKNPIAVIVGGSMLYVDAVCKGVLDDIPTIDTAIREQVKALYQQHGLEFLQEQVQQADEAYWQQVDKNNPQRLMHCLAVKMQTGKPLTSFWQQKKREEKFDFIKLGLQMPREKLYEQINARVDKMMEQGLLQEAEKMYPNKHLNALNTVGYKELFRYFDGEYTLEEAIEKIKQHSRHYAKRQMTWFRADQTINWINKDEKYEEIIRFVDDLLR